MSEIAKAMRRARAPPPRRWPHIYELRSINLSLLPEQEARAVLENFAAMLNALTAPAEIRVVEDRRTVALGDELYEIPYKRFFVASQEPLEDALSIAGLRFVKVPSMPELKITADAPRFAVDGEGRFVRVYNLIGLAPSWRAGWMADLYPYLHEARISLRPLEGGRDEAVRHYRSLAAAVELRMREGRHVDPERAMELEAARAASEAVASGREQLFLVRVLLVIRAKDAQELEQKRRNLRSRLHGMIDSPLHMNAAMYLGIGPEWARGRELYMPTSTLVSFFPFAGLDLIDPTPTAVVLGQNLLTGNVIAYDVYERENYNIAIFGQTGYGKSTLVKAWVSRLSALDPDLHLWVFDSIVRPEYALGPSGAYEGSFAELVGASVLDLSQPQAMDPLQVFESRAAALSFIADLAGITEPDLRAELNLLKSEHVQELPAEAGGSLGKRLEAGLRPFSHLWSGRESTLTTRQVFVLSSIEGSAVRDAAAYLALAWVWRNVKRLPVRTRKLIVVDEGWAFVETNPKTGKPYFPAAVEFVPEVARTGRHYNAAFMIATQRVSDMMQGPGRVVLENAATKVVLHQDSAAAEMLAGPLSLSREEVQFVVGARIGQALLVTPEGHMPFYALLSKSELARFTTKPAEVRA
ncbi:MAG: VirB4 family type IV secretion system protein [Conexivisphaera sp.]